MSSPIALPTAPSGDDLTLAAVVIHAARELELAVEAARAGGLLVTLRSQVRGSILEPGAGDVLVASFLREFKLSAGDVDVLLGALARATATATAPLTSAAPEVPL